MQTLNTGIGGIRSNRLLSMFLDHALMTIVMMMALSPWMIGLSNRLDTADPSQPFFYMPDWAMALWALGGSLYLNKDIRRGQSFAKQMFGFRVVDSRTGGEAGPFRLFIRNLTAIIFPIEIALLLRDPSRRLGDMIAGTKLVLSDSADEFPLSSTAKIISSLALAFILTLAMTAGASKLMQQALKPDFIRSSFNLKLGDSLGKVVGNEVSADIREASFDVFDSTRNGEGGYIQGMIGVANDSILIHQDRFADMQGKALIKLAELTGSQPYKAVIRYYAISAPSRTGEVRTYQLPAGTGPLSEGISGTWIPEGIAIPEELDSTATRIPLFLYGNETSSISIAQGRITWSDSTGKSVREGNYYVIDEDSTLVIQSGNNFGSNQVIIMNDSVMYLRGRDASLLKLRR